MSLLHRDARQEPLEQLSCFRGEFYACLTTRSDALFELADAVLCGDGPVRSLAELSLVGEHRRGHGGLYAAMARGRIDVDRLQRALAELPQQAAIPADLGPARRAQQPSMWASVWPADPPPHTRGAAKPAPAERIGPIPTCAGSSN